MGAWIETPGSEQEAYLDYESLPSWERGLKQCIRYNLHDIINVAPFVGAWIETTQQFRHFRPSWKSLPSWERGLKPFFQSEKVDFVVRRSLRGSVE